MSFTVEQITFNQHHLETFWWFVCERQRIWQRRVQAGLPPPWTDDPVLRAERFTNVYRELDPGTRYAIERILEQDAPAPDRIFNVMIYRLIGRSETHRAIEFQHVETFSGDRLRRAMNQIRQCGKSPFTAAYMVSGYTSMGSRDKIENVARIFEHVARDFDRIERAINDAQHPSEVHSALKSAPGFGDFLAYQVLVDLLYPLNSNDGRPLLPFSHDDWGKAGPGARRGIELIRGTSGLGDLAVMRWLWDRQEAEFERLDLDFPWLRDTAGKPVRLTLANIQNCLCEFHKYVKIRDGTGRGRRKFLPDDESLGLLPSPRIGRGAGGEGDQPNSKNL